VVEMELENIKVSATVIVISKDDKVLITQRPPNESFPNLWTVAGGKLQDEDGQKITEGFLKNSIEGCARRELFEETGIHIWYMPLHYFSSFTTIWGDTKRLILSFYIVMDKDAKDLKITLSKECQTYRWIEEYMVDSYNFIPDIDEEIHGVFKLLREKRQADIERIING
jgi:8-oxo-dGTP pyrophosphatase MutT (NUDIX family)